MGVPTTLTPQGETALEDAVSASRSFEAAEAERRRAAVKALGEGVPISVVAERIGVTRPTLYRWREELEAADFKPGRTPAEQELVDTYGDIL